MIAAESSVASVAGYRLTRKLGVGSRAEVYLAAGASGPVAIKQFFPGVDRDSVGNELDALGRLDSPHLVRLLDVGSADDDRPVLILERVQRGSLAALLTQRESLELGEVVTILAPLAGAVTTMHRAGVAHGGIGMSTVHIASGGVPVLIGFGHSELFASGSSIAAIDAEPAAVRERAAFATFAGNLLARVRGADTDSRVQRLLDWIREAPREYEFLERLEGRLFDSADPMPLRLNSRPESAPAVPARTEVAQSHDLALRIDAALRNNPVDALRARVLRFVRSVRRRYWLAAGVGVLGLVVAICSLPQGSAAAPSATPSPQLSAPPALALPDDPVQALPLLLVARTACVRELSVLCLDTVDDQNSGAYGADATLIEQLQGGTEIPKSAVFSASAPRVVETLGNSAIVSLGANTNPASVLMIKTEAGWRIRSYLSGVQATASPGD